MSQARLHASEGLITRAYHAWQSRGVGYLWHKALRRSPGRWRRWKRRLLYHDPRTYWTWRGGEDYFREQEDQQARTERSLWLAKQIASFQPRSILEIGAGYGKQLRAIRQQFHSPMVGLDFSPTQLAKASNYLRGLSEVRLVLGDGQSLPFPDNAFDLVLTSAVILHNEPERAQRIRKEVIRVGRQWAVHNEDTDITYNRFGYDTASWYRSIGLQVLEDRPIPVGSSAEIARSQFCVARL